MNLLNQGVVMFNRYLVIFLGGGFGASLRFFTANLLAKTQINFPVGILLVNVSGCFLMGILATVLSQKAYLPDIYKWGLLIGFLGGYTTFSSFSMDVVNLLQSGYYAKALSYVLLSVVFSIAATILGVFIATAA